MAGSVLGMPPHLVSPSLPQPAPAHPNVYQEETVTDKAWYKLPRPVCKLSKKVPHLPYLYLRQICTYAYRAQYHEREEVLLARGQGKGALSMPHKREQGKVGVCLEKSRIYYNPVLYTGRDDQISDL